MIRFLYNCTVTRSIVVFLLLSFFLFISPLLSAYETEHTGIFSMALSDNAVGWDKRNDFICAIRSWIQLFVAEHNFEATGVVDVFNSTDKTKSAFFLNKFDSFVLTPLDLENMTFTPENVYLTVQDNGFYVNYLVLVRKKGNIKQIQDLKDEKIGIRDDGWAILSRPWFKSLLMRKNRLLVKKMDEDLVSMHDPEKGILQVFFGQLQAVVVRKQAFEIACELNPQLGSELRILEKSPPFIPIFMIFNQSKRREVVQKMKDAVPRLHHGERGKQILFFYRGIRMEKHPFSVLDPTIAFVNDYRKMAREKESTD